jgi:hypothetical protein
MTSEELTWFLAEKVMEWERWSAMGKGFWMVDHDTLALPLGIEWLPLTNLNHAFMVVDRMHSKGWKVQILWHPDINKWGVIFWPGDTMDDETRPQQAHEQNLCHAIANAAKKAFEGSQNG